MKPLSKQHGWAYPQDQMNWDRSIFDDGLADSPCDKALSSCTDKTSELEDQNPVKSSGTSHTLDHNTNVNTGDVKRVYCCHVCSFTSPSCFHYRLHLVEHTPHIPHAHRNHTSHTHTPDNHIHIQSVQPVRPDPHHPRCAQCGYLGDGDLDSRQHAQTHNNEKRYVCVVCNNSYSSFTRTLEHFRYRHKEVAEGKHILDRKILHRHLAKRPQRIVLLDAQVVLKAGEVEEELERQRRDSESNLPQAEDLSTGGACVSQEVEAVQSESASRPETSGHCLTSKPFSISAKQLDRIQEFSRSVLKKSFSIDRKCSRVDKRSKRDRSPGNQ